MRYTQKDLSSAITNFDYREGKLYWKVMASNRVKVGSEAGSVRKDGYRIVSISGNGYQTQIVVWAMHNGRWPDKGVEIDHKNNNPSDNRIENLRQSTASQNQHNSLISASNTSGAKGVSKSGNSWRSNVCKNGKIYSKTFKSFNDCVEFTELLREELHGQYACHG